MYAKIINEDTKEVMIGQLNDIEFYKSIGMTEDIEVEQAYDNKWYVKGYAPVKEEEPIKTVTPASNTTQEQTYEFTDAQIINNKITMAKNYLYDTDYCVIKIAEGKATFEEYQEIIDKRDKTREEINSLQEQLENLNKENGGDE